MKNNFGQANIKGMNWKHADLQFADFHQCQAGLSFTQGIGLQLILYGLAAFTGFISGVAGIGATNLLSLQNIHRFTYFPGVAVLIFVWIGIVIAVKRGFAEFIGSSAALFCGVAILFLLSRSELWGNFLFSIAITAIPELVALQLGSIVSLIDKGLSKSIGAILIIMASIGVVTGLSSISRLNPYVKPDWLDGIVALSLLFAATVIGKKAVQPNQQFLETIQWASRIVTLMGGTSFRAANLAGANFSQADVRHTDFRGANLFQTYWWDVKGLEFARLEQTYLADARVRKLVTTLNGQSQNFDALNLEGVNLKDAILKGASFVETNLHCAILQAVDLRDSILVRVTLTGADLSGADLTGICIQDWSINSETDFSGIRCDYVYREFENNQPTNRYPSDRDFQPGEFESLFQKLTNAVELVFQDQIDWRALSFTFEKFRLEDDGMGLELKGIEQRGNYWIVKVTHGEGVSKQQVEQQVQSTYEDLRSIMEAKDKQINRLLGIVETQTEAMQRQAEALTNFSQQPFGNHFLISGSTITNLAGSGQIEYREAAHGVRSLITNQIDPNSNLQELLGQLKHQNVATTSATQRDLIQQVLFSEADRDPALKQFLLEKGQHILDRLPDGEFKIAIRNAISLIRND
ncbi:MULTISPECIES: pentapeptide repeat-containing protein [Leptolyngbya]|nr:pentapeptide repeat-containing protein [Leptolyngbya boryana]MBD2369050.1 pentapeptide repeat-containing protein [Leptolyngbya sp. FACHB-161]MBD2377692.1 pentapeptide repeat-containing protein [Leptolyngbya sp. FACHB-238]MBD2399856.1 pentapeptide repeat-containing protein [Leptolyngbya sp. FACHB-239]MBD2406062.1 pentapeptide repeat-containing protein [Leptolyngbya sp. FACHB-402]ULP28108.1 pentapeptide repeat-containing protein [Leptolyngbya boryana IU 594]